MGNNMLINHYREEYNKFLTNFFAKENNSPSNDRARELINNIFKERNLKIEQLVATTMLERHTFTKLLNSNPEHSFTKSTLIAFCLGAQVPCEQAFELFLHAGYVLTGTLGDYYLKFIIEKYTVYEANEELSSNHLPLIIRNSYKKSDNKE